MSEQETLLQSWGRLMDAWLQLAGIVIVKPLARFLGWVNAIILPYI